MLNADSYSHGMDESAFNSMLDQVPNTGSVPTAHLL